MSFAASVAGKAVFWLFFILSCLQNEIFSNGHDVNECIDECERNYPFWKSEQKGELLCYVSPGSNLLGGSTPCLLKCRGKKPEEDQLKCWKELCDDTGGRGFCEKPGTDSIKADQCEELLNAEKVKFYRMACKID